MDFVEIPNAVTAGSVDALLDAIDSGSMICVSSFEHVGRSPVYIGFIEQALTRWMASVVMAADGDDHTRSFNVIDGGQSVREQITSSKSQHIEMEPFWTEYEWLKRGGFTVESLAEHDRSIYAQNGPPPHLQDLAAHRLDDEGMFNFNVLLS